MMMIVTPLESQQHFPQAAPVPPPGPFSQSGCCLQGMSGPLPSLDGKGKGLLLPCAECRRQRSHYASLNRRLCLAAIILFSAADASPPFLNWEYSAAFSSAGRAMSERNDTPRPSDLGNTWKGAGDMAWRKPERWEEEVQASLYRTAYFNGLFLQVCT